jgi:hypothetical protein
MPLPLYYEQVKVIVDVFFCFSYWTIKYLGMGGL